MNAVRHSLPTSLPARSDPAERLLGAFALRERVEGLIEPFLEELLRTSAGLHRHRGFYDGAWDLGLRSGPGPVSRLEFSVKVDLDAIKVELACRSSTHDKDHDSQRLDVVLDESGEVALQQFVETACLLFAGRFFEGPAAS